MRLSHLLLAGIITAGAPAAFATEPSPLWRTVGEWQVRVDPTLGQGCFMIGGYVRGDILRIGFDNKNRIGYIMLGNPKWESLEIGKIYAVNLQFDSGQPVTWRGRATDMNGSKVLYFPFDNMHFMKSFAEHNSLTVSYNNNLVTQLLLTGTYAAVQVLVDCNRQFLAATGDDPFRSGVPSNDPFSPASGN
jgi:hypothetical protein